MIVIDADAHVEESPATFSDAYLDPAFRKRKPQVVNSEGRLYWRVEDQIYPRLFGRGCHNMGTPAHHEGHRSFYTASKPESIESIEISHPDARLKDMADEDLEVQVIYPSFFLGHPLVTDPALGAALCSSYNRWLADIWANASDRLRWVVMPPLLQMDKLRDEIKFDKENGACVISLRGLECARRVPTPDFYP